MRVNSIFDVAGGIILLAIIAVVATHPTLVTSVTGGFTNALNAARKG